MIFSKTVSYALQTVIYLSSKPQDIPIMQKDIAKALDIPHFYLGKIIQPLVHNGFLNSKRGIAGGFTLAKPAEEISLCEIVGVFDNKNYFDDCILGFPGCNDKTPCPVHDDWKPAKAIIQNLMKEHTVAEWGATVGTKLDYIKMLSDKKITD